MRPEKYRITYHGGYVYMDGSPLYDDFGKHLTIGRYERLNRKSITITVPEGIGKSEYKKKGFKEPNYLYY